MLRKILTVNIFWLFSLIGYSQTDANPQIEIYPPQIHQQICQESTFTRYLNIINTGDQTLIYTAAFSPDTVNWVAAAPLNGIVQPGDTSLVEFNFNSVGLPVENYLADFVISSNDPFTPEKVVLTMLHVQDLHITINPDEDSICMGCSTKLNTSVFGCSEAYYFSWTSDPPGFYSTEKSPSVSPEESTIYMVTVTDGGYSKADSVEIFVNGTIGLPENHVLSGISIFPNPVNYIFKVRFSSEYYGQGFIKINDMSGRMVQSEKIFIEEGLNELSIQIFDCEPGVYLLSVHSDNKVIKAGVVYFTTTSLP